MVNLTFEQISIKFFNEKLQQFFNYHMLMMEQEPRTSSPTTTRKPAPGTILGCSGRRLRRMVGEEV